jgi:hypothetical protein
MFMAGYGAGGIGTANPAGAGALTGVNGNPGIVQVWEYS